MFIILQDTKKPLSFLLWCNTIRKTNFKNKFITSLVILFNKLPFIKSEVSGSLFQIDKLGTYLVILEFSSEVPSDLLKVAI